MPIAAHTAWNDMQLNWHYTPSAAARPLRGPGGRRRGARKVRHKQAGLSKTVFPDCSGCRTSAAEAQAHFPRLQPVFWGRKCCPRNWGGGFVLQPHLSPTLLGARPPPAVPRFLSKPGKENGAPPCSPLPPPAVLFQPSWSFDSLSSMLHPIVCSQRLKSLVFPCGRQLSRT